MFEGAVREDEAGGKRPGRARHRLRARAGERHAALPQARRAGRRRAAQRQPLRPVDGRVQSDERGDGGSGEDGEGRGMNARLTRRQVRRRRGAGWFFYFH